MAGSVIDDIVAGFHRLTERFWRGAAGARLNGLLGALRPRPPLDNGHYLAVATRFELGRMRNVMKRHRERAPQRLAAMLATWRETPYPYLILKVARNGRCVDPFVGCAVLMPLTSEAGEKLISGEADWSDVRRTALQPPPARHVYGVFAEAYEAHRSALMPLLVKRVTTELTTEGVWFIARPITEEALHFYRSRGFVRPDGSTPQLHQICYTNTLTNRRFSRFLKAVGAANAG